MKRPLNLTYRDKVKTDVAPLPSVHLSGEKLLDNTKFPVAAAGSEAIYAPPGAGKTTAIKKRYHSKVVDLDEAYVKRFAYPPPGWFDSDSWRNVVGGLMTWTMAKELEAGNIVLGSFPLDQVALIPGAKVSVVIMEARVIQANLAKRSGPTDAAMSKEIPRLLGEAKDFSDAHGAPIYDSIEEAVDHALEQRGDKLPETSNDANNASGDSNEDAGPATSAKDRPSVGDFVASYRKGSDAQHEDEEG